MELTSSKLQLAMRSGCAITPRLAALAVHAYAGVELGNGEGAPQEPALQERPFHREQARVVRVFCREHRIRATVDA
jgi:hypothetical protein